MAHLRIAQRNASKHEAYLAFRNGDNATGLAKVVGNTHATPRLPDVELQVAGQLAEICSRLKNEGLASRASDVAALTLARISQALPRLSPNDSARANALSGQILDHVLRDTERARVAYQRALDLDPSQKRVAERLAHIVAVETRAREKTEANEMLRRRALEGNR